MSDFYNKYPYTDFHELNLDWVIERVKKLTEDWAATLEEWNSTEEQWQELYDYVHDYFDNLDVQEEINNKINAMIADGTFVTITTPVIEAKVASMMPGVVSDQIGGAVAGQIGNTVAGQLPGVVSDQIGAAVVDPVNNWLAAHITQPTTPAIDTSLSIAGAAADAKAVGDAFSDLIAPLYNSASTYNVGDYVTYNNKLYRCSTAITTPEVWTVSHWSLLNAVDAMDTYHVTVINTIEAIDLNNAEANTIRRCQPGCSNAPTTQGTLLTLSSTSDTAMQLFVGPDARSYVRAKWGTWTAWTEVLSSNSLSSLVHAISTVTAIDLNTADANSVRRCPSGSSNAPAVQGTVLNIGATNDTGLQFYVSAEGNAFIRSKWGSWTSWQSVLTPANIVNHIGKNILTAFTNISCYGDSLTWSQVYTGVSSSRQAYRTYPDVLATLTGATVENVSTAGYTTIQWWSAYENSIVSKPNQLVIIYLANNGGLTDTLATDAPENTPYNTWANTNTGCYAKIVAKAISLGARVLLVKCYDVGATTNSVIEQIAARFKCAVVSNPKLGEEYRTYPDGSGVNPIHYNDLGYAKFAENLLINSARMSDTYIKNIIPI